MTPFAFFILRAFLSTFALLLLVALYTIARRRGHKRVCATRWAYFRPLIWVVLLIWVAAQYVVPSVLDAHSLVYTIRETETVEVQGIDWRGQLITNQGKRLYSSLLPLPEWGQTYRLYKLPWTGLVMEWAPVEPKEGGAMPTPSSTQPKASKRVGAEPLSPKDPNGSSASVPASVPAAHTVNGLEPAQGQDHLASPPEEGRADQPDKEQT